MAEGIGARAKAWWHARRQTDEQYVERIRKKQRSMRKALFGERCDELLLKFYDELKSRELDDGDTG